MTKTQRSSKISEPVFVRESGKTDILHACERRHFSDPGSDWLFGSVFMLWLGDIGKKIDFRFGLLLL